MQGINLKIIPHNEQRYPTVGDWWTDDNDIWQIRVSKLSDWRYEFLVFFHEVLEMAYCKWNNISQSDVDLFDIEYENNRKEGDISEPGDNKNAPYYLGHQIANICEKIAAQFLGVNWQEYDNEVVNL